MSRHPSAERPSLIHPMLATAGALPTGPAEAGWAFEMKWDGVRAVVYVADGRARALSRNERDISVSYPELQDVAASLSGLSLILDGELVAADARGRPDFGTLQQRMHVTDPGAVRRLVATVPVTFLVFDLLWLEGRSLLDDAYDARRSALEGLRTSGPWDVPPAFAGDGAAALAASRAAGLEGVVAKRRDSRYVPGSRSSAWLKVKHQHMQEVVIGGWRAGQGGRDGRIGSLLLGVQGPDGLEYAGHVGTGFTDAALAELAELLNPLRRKTSPFSVELPRVDARDAVWVEPQLVGEVTYGEWTATGRLRHPSWRGLRDDKSPSEVHREDP
jgi:bifunctional non-homologous end joining protein LigD